MAAQADRSSSMGVEIALLLVFGALLLFGATASKSKRGEQLELPLGGDNHAPSSTPAAA